MNHLFSRPTIGVIRLEHAGDLALPAYNSELAAGMDLRAAVQVPVVIKPGKRALIPTGLVMELPAGYEGQVRPRSGLAVRNGITCLNSPGTIDADYRGEVSVLLINLGETPFEVVRGMRIAQLVVTPVARAIVEPVHRLSGTARGKGGFGSTGTD